MVDIAAIEKRAEAATEGPWTVKDNAIGESIFIESKSDGHIARTTLRSAGDSDFIAHARQDVPDLLAERAELIEALRRTEHLCKLCTRDNDPGPSAFAEILAIVRQALSLTRGEKVEEGRT